MRSKIFQEMLDEVPKETEIFARLYADLVLRVNSILAEKGLTQRALAEQLDKSPSEINKWLSGSHNFTLRSIAKLEAELGETLLVVPTKGKLAKEISISKRTIVSHTIKKMTRDIPRVKTEFKKIQTSHKTDTQYG